ncbi:hypothetical protein [Rheinheimera oceanensis]|uniref:hypothetical protein n=1 Tax=Rheinheimera oceanensis TaxID=2817449 RepID=UPI001BFD3E92|nr:hypothetical protein [Rheinheimera oceanensis]
MPSIDARIKKVLKYIKENPRCNSKGLEADLVKDLIEQGFLSGNISRTLNSPTYCSQLLLTSNGEKRLESLRFTSLPKWFWPSIFTALLAIVGTVILKSMGF